jgi:glycosyltransferase involved in cell wall biosynthesis
VVPEAADAIFHKLVSHEEIQSLRSFYAIPAKPYVFYVGGLEGRKNFEVVLKAIAAMQQKGAFQLVLAGGAAADRARLEAIAKDLKVSEFVSFLGRVPDEHLPGLYSGALAMVYPSRLEGFGLQLVEAMARGCPMVVSRATSLPEVAGHAGEYFDPDDAAGLAAILDRLAIDKNYEDWLRGKSAERSGSFSWEILARGTLDVYRELVNG